MAANEISGKLAEELYERIIHLEKFCDERAKNDTDWLSASVMAFDLRAHLMWHIQQNDKEKEM